MVCYEYPWSTKLSLVSFIIFNHQLNSENPTQNKQGCMYIVTLELNHCWPPCTMLKPFHLVELKKFLAVTKCLGSLHFQLLWNFTMIIINYSTIIMVFSAGWIDFMVLLRHPSKKKWIKSLLWLHVFLWISYISLFFFVFHFCLCQKIIL